MNSKLRYLMCILLWVFFIESGIDQNANTITVFKILCMPFQAEIVYSNPSERLNVMAFGGTIYRGLPAENP